ncbi:MAG: DUF503 domain-containing protein [candidate division Zixibacteria bacterium]|nr:DUF503 domain-containing protein [candidate division Zixibacteria bacterium]
MQLATLTIRLQIPQSRSLKSKRQVISGIKDRLKNKFNISIAEVADNDLWQVATLGIAVVANQRRFLDQVLDQVENYIASRPEVVILDSEKVYY